jgi:hypothetical protein
MNRPKLALIALVVLIVLFGIGYALGASGRRTAEQALSGTEQQIDIATARSLLLQARVSLYNVNFGDAQRQLQDALAPLTRVRQRFQKDGNDSAVASLSAALEHTQQAQTLAGKLDQAANTQAAQALQALEETRQEEGRRK